MVASAESTRQKKRDKKGVRSSSTGDYPLVDREERRHRREKYTLIGDDGQEQHHYDRPRRSKQHKRVVVEEDHLYDVVRPRAVEEEGNTYENVAVPSDSLAVYQNMDDL